VLTPRASLATGGFRQVLRITQTPTRSPATGPACACARIPLGTWSSTSSTDRHLRARHPAVGGGPRRGAILLNARASASWSARPTIKDSAPRDMVSRAIYRRSRGRGEGGKDFVHLDVRHLPKEVIETKLPDITEFARLPRVDPRPSSCRSSDRPLRHGWHPTDVESQVVVDGGQLAAARAVRGGGMRCVSVHGANRLGTTRCSTYRVRAGAAASRWRSTRRAELAPLPDDRQRGPGPAAGLLERSGVAPATSGSPRCGRGSGRDDADCGCRADDESLGGCSAPSRSCGSATSGRASGQGQHLQHRAAGGREMGFLLDLAR